jgi:hypothetical protein
MSDWDWFLIIYGFAYIFSMIVKRFFGSLFGYPMDLILVLLNTGVAIYFYETDDDGTPFHLD